MTAGRLALGQKPFVLTPGVQKDKTPIWRVPQHGSISFYPSEVSHKSDAVICGCSQWHQDTRLPFQDLYLLREPVEFCASAGPLRMLTSLNFVPRLYSLPSKVPPDCCCHPHSPSTSLPRAALATEPLASLLAAPAPAW